MFIFVCNNFDADFAQQISMLSFKFKSYKDCFDLKNTKMLFIQENKNHVINLKFDKKLLCDFLYAHSEKKLQILQNYLLKNFALSCIREFLSFAEILILFIFKNVMSQR